jgi:multiple antibiotic resistance protein
MTMTAGVIFFLVALKQLMQQYEPPHQAAPEPLPASPVAAALSLVFPIVLTPYGIAAVIALLAASPDSMRTLTIFGLLMLVMVLNLIAMTYARRILVGSVAIVLQVLGAVLAVLQVALSVEFIIRGLRGLGVLPNVT